MRLVRRGEQVEGTLHLTPHHLIFCHTPPSTPESPNPKPRELWITYQIIHKCTLKPSAPTSRVPSSLRLQCRDFTFVCFCFDNERKAREVYDSVRAWTCKLGRIEKLYAFTYQPQKPEKEVNGWEVYDARKEYERLGICEKPTDKGWRISSVNSEYSVGISASALKYSCSTCTVFAHIPSTPLGPGRNIRQHTQLCSQVSFTWTLTRPYLSPSCQQLFHHSMCSAFGWCEAK